MHKHKCKVCDKEFSTKKTTSKYCSKDCFYIGRPKPQRKRIHPIHTCPVCNQKFEAIPSSVDRGRAIYCSRECLYAGRHKKREVNCLICGTSFLRRHTKHKYCSRHCFNKATKNGDILYRPYCSWRFKDSRGYIQIRLSSSSLFYPMTGVGLRYKSFVSEHRLKMAKSLGRILQPSEIVHHKNGIKDDNRLSNLELSDRNNHIANHNQGYRNGFLRGFRDGKNEKIRELEKQIELLKMEIGGKQKWQTQLKLIK